MNNNNNSNVIITIMIILMILIITVIIKIILMITIIIVLLITEGNLCQLALGHQLGAAARLRRPRHGVVFSTHGFKRRNNV